MRRLVVAADVESALTLLDQVAVVAGVTDQDPQSAFRRYDGTTPIGYLGQVRLESAHAQLRGWANPAQFAAAFRQRFGVPPGNTLCTGSA